MAKSEVVFMVTPGAFGNLIPLVEFAHLLVNHDPRFHATILIITMPQRPTINTYVESRAVASAASISFLYLPIEPVADHEVQTSIAYLSLLIQKQKPHVKDALAGLMSSPGSNPVVAFFVDMFCTSMIDVANELELPCYMFFPSPATFLNFMIHIPVLDAQISGDFGDLDTELTIPGFANSVPPLVLPTALLKKKEGDSYSCYLTHTARYKEPKGYVVNTFKELEPHPLNALASSDVPPVYAIGPIIDLNGPAQWQEPERVESVVKWLDDQPPSSVVFLCFGSMGSLSGPQVREIAFGLERAKFRFLWSLREPPKSGVYLPSDPENIDKVLPDGFLKRTSKLGLVCGWVPQVKILAHEVIGGFVSHCGWNSILESLWYGVPIATWPIYAEQQMNAFEMVKELRLAVEIRLDYRGGDMVLAEEVERSIKSLMDGDQVVRARVKDMKEKCRMARMKNGSAYQALECLIEELMPKI